MKMLDAAFAHPRGVLGRLGGLIMARSTGPRNAWILSQLNIQSDDHILEVGFGPGTTIHAIAAITTEGCITGIDESPLMVHMAAKRNARTMLEQRTRLLQGSVLALPFANAAFNKALSINSVQIWSDRLAGLQEMRRVLQPGGLLVIALQPVWVKTDSEVRKIGEELVEQLASIGFQQTRLEFKSMKPMACVCALGIK